MPSDPTALKLCCNICSMSIGLHTGCRFLTYAAKLLLAFLFTFDVSTCLLPHKQAELAVLFVNVLRCDTLLQMESICCCVLSYPTMS